MSWLFGGDGDQDRAARAQARTPSGRPAPRLCEECRALKSQCQCKLGIVVGDDGKQRCRRCAHETVQCTCPSVWGRREIELRASMALGTRVSNMVAFLAQVHETIDAAKPHAETYTQLTAHGEMLLSQEKLLEAQRNKGVLTERLLEQHNSAVEQWMELCDAQLGITMRQLDLSTLSDSIRHNSSAVSAAPPVPVVPREPEEADETDGGRD